MPDRPIDEATPPRASHGARAIRWIAPLLALAALASIGIRLLSQTPVGVADNGDGWRVMAPAGVAHRAPLGAFESRVVERSFRARDTRFWSHPSSGAALVCVARAWPFGAPGDFDLRQLVVVHLAVLVLALGAAFARRASAAIVAAVALAISSPFYADFLASFYPDAAALLGLASVALALEPPEDARGARVQAVSLVVGASLLGFSSRAHAFLPSLVVLAFALGTRLRDRPARATALALALVAVLAPLHFERGTGFRFPPINHHHAVFRGVAELADDPSAVLLELGLPANARWRVGRSYFDDPPDPPLTRALERATPLRVLGAYATRPRAAARAIALVARALAGRVPIGLNHGARPGARFEEPPLAVHALRTHWLPPPFAFLLPTVALWVARRHARRWLVPMGFLLGTLGLEAVSTILGDGTFAIARHLLIASFALDVLILLSLAVLLAGWRAERERERARARA